MTTRLEPVLRRRIIYPERDGKPMGETETHRQELSDAIEALKDFFRAQADVYISGNMFIYYEKGVPQKVICPDVFVVHGVDRRRRRIYQLWKENHSPCFVLGFTSRATRREDEREKMVLYAQLSINEYFLCDPLNEYLHPPLQGFRLVGGVYRPIVPTADGWLVSQELGVKIRIEEEGLRFADTTTGERLLKPTEVAEARRAEAEARRIAEDEVARLRAEIERLQAK